MVGIVKKLRLEERRVDSDGVLVCPLNERSPLMEKIS